MDGSLEEQGLINGLGDSPRRNFLYGILSSKLYIVCK